ADPGGICISARVREDAAGKVAIEVDDLGVPELKKNSARVQVYRVRLGADEGRNIAKFDNPPLVLTPSEPPRADRQLNTSPCHPAFPLPDKPSPGVLPFQNMSGEPEQEYFVDGMVEEITTAVSRIRGLFVIARNSSFTYKGQAVAVKQVGRELGVQY